MDDFIHTYLGECDVCHYCVTYAVYSSETNKVLAIFSLSFDSKKPDNKGVVTFLDAYAVEGA